MNRLQAESAVDGENLAGDEMGADGEEEDGGGDIVGRAVAAHGGTAGKVLELVGDLAVDDHAGSDAVHADFRSPGFRHGAGEHVQGGLGGAVVGVGGPGMESAEGADVDDAAAGGFQIRVSGLSGEEGGAGVGFEHGVPLFDGDGFEGSGFEAAGIVDEDVEAGEAGGGGLDGGADLSGIAEFGAKGKGVDAESLKIGNRLSRFGFRVAPGNGDAGAGFGQGQGQAAPDALCATGDEGDLSLQRGLGIHGPILILVRGSLQSPGCNSTRSRNILQ